MPYAYTVPSAIADATNKAITASLITEIIGDAEKSASHADAHIKAENLWATQRTGPNGPIGSISSADGHLKSAYAKRKKHSMFDSPVSAVEAVTAALNTEIGRMALNELYGQSDGIDLYSRTAVATLAGTQQITRANPAQKATATATLNKNGCEYIVVCLRKTADNYLMIASAYPVDADATSKAKEMGNDWFQKQSNKTIVKALALTSPPVVNW